MEDLTTDHSAEAWRRHEAGQVIRLRDVAVVCRRCNAERGAARGARADQHTRWERPDLRQLADELELEDRLEFVESSMPASRPASTRPGETVSGVCRVPTTTDELEDQDRLEDELELEDDPLE